MKEKNIAILLPAYNEELTISKTIHAFYQQLPDALFVIINNNSTDNTVQIAEKTLQDLNANGIILHEYRQGKGNAIRCAFSKIEADIYLMVDADMSYPADKVKELIKPILLDTADMVVGDRHSSGLYQKENKRILHNFGNKLVVWLVNTFFHANLLDIMSGYRTFSRQFVKNYPILVEGFQIETDLTLHALDKRFRILEIPIEYKDRPDGSVSKLNTFSDGTKVIFTIFQILRYYRPLLFFSSIAFIFCLFGLLAAVPVFQDWIEYKYIYHVPLAILSVGLELLAFMLLSVGLILDSITRQHRFSYEKDLLKK